MELELEGPTPSERASVEMEGITLTLLGLGVKGILAIVELLTHFWKRNDFYEIGTGPVNARQNMSVFLNNFLGVTIIR